MLVHRGKYRTEDKNTDNCKN